MSLHKISVREAESWITEEHLRIRALLDGVRGISDPHVLLPVLRELRSILEEHFSREEGDDGLHDIVSGPAPEHGDRVDDLIVEHGRILKSVDDLIGKCSACVAGPLAAIRRNIGELYGLMQSHDAAESEILTDALIKEMEKPES